MLALHGEHTHGPRLPLAVTAGLGNTPAERKGVFKNSVKGNKIEHSLTLNPFH